MQKVINVLKLIRNTYSAMTKDRPQVTIAIVLIVLMTVLSFASKVFLTYENLFNLFRSTSIYGVIAIGITFVILTAGIDLSVGSVVGLSSILVSLFMKQGYPISIAILIALLASVLAGAMNGVIIHFGKVAPFIATLGSMTIIRGIVKLISGAKIITGFSKEFVGFATGKFLFLPNLFWVWGSVIILSWIVLKYTVFGRNIYSIGSNQEAARLSGINIGKNIVFVYTVSGGLSGVAGIMLASRLASGLPLAGVGYELDAIAATVVGGTSLFGAIGGTMGTALGSILITTIRNGGVLLGLNSFILEILVGALIVLAVIAQRRK